jgi:hypothetical protein
MEAFIQICMVTGFLWSVVTPWVKDIFFTKKKEKPHLKGSLPEDFKIHTDSDDSIDVNLTDEELAQLKKSEPSTAEALSPDLPAMTSSSGEALSPDSPDPSSLEASKDLGTMQIASVGVLPTPLLEDSFQSSTPLDVLHLAFLAGFVTASTIIQTPSDTKKGVLKLKGIENPTVSILAELATL